MILSNKQEQCVKMAVDRYKNKEKYTVIGGPAGCGKSSTVKFIIEALNVKKEDVCYATYTGKAARVLLKKGNKNVTTLHKLLYKSVLMPNGTYRNIPVTEIPYKVIVIDEVSMAPKSMLQLLIRFPVHIICLGDNAQLPPVNKEEDNHLLDNPHFYLDEIFRQAQESEIIRLTMDIRAGRSLKPFKGKEVMILNKNELTSEICEWADQIICAKNKTRIDINKKMRELMGFENRYPQKGDKIICLDNYWEILSEINQEPFINGTIGYLGNSFTTFFRYPEYIYKDREIQILNGTIEIEDGDYFSSVDMDKKMVITGESSVDNKILYKIMKNPRYSHLIPIQITYGYAITCWKAQGSEWSKVLAIEEDFPWNKEEHKKYLYTAATRAQDKLVLILNN